MAETTESPTAPARLANRNGLRDALKELRAYCGKYVDDPNASEAEQLAYDDVAIQLAQLLSRHPAEPVGVSDEAVEALVKTSGLHGKYRVEKVRDPEGKHNDCRYFVLDPQHDTAAADAVRYYASLVQASRRDLYDDLVAWLGQPFMQPQVLAGLAFRERVAEVLGSELPSGYKFEAYILADALLAAGVFREPPAREQMRTSWSREVRPMADVRREVPTDDAAFQYLWNNLVAMEMRHRGYSDEEIELASRVPSHTADCEYEHNTYSWICDDGDGKSFHPVTDEYGEVADLIGRTLERTPEANQ